MSALGCNRNSVGVRLESIDDALRPVLRKLLTAERRTFISTVYSPTSNPSVSYAERDLPVLGRTQYFDDLASPQTVWLPERC
jgi:hypothetical protein